MKYLVVMIVGLMFAPCLANAATKRLECAQTTDKGVEQMVFAVIDDASDKAEVELFALSAACAKDRSCGTKIYSKDVLPSVIRLNNVLRIGREGSYVTTIDIDRSTLTIVSRTSFTSTVGNTDSLARGQCTMKVDAAKKIL
jgi:hypothetical protein